jgi:hypothetical protein
VLWHSRLVAVTQRLGARSSSSSGYRLRERGGGTCLRSLGSFRLRLAVRGSVTTSTTG